MATQELTTHADDQKRGMTLAELEAWCKRMREQGAHGTEQPRVRAVATMNKHGGGIRSMVLHVADTAAADRPTG